MKTQAIRDLLKPGRPPTLSVEIMPPRTPSAESSMESLLNTLYEGPLSFVSVTYGAGGSTRDRTRTLVERLVADNEITPMSHLTCIAHTKTEVREMLVQYRDFGLKNVLALRGDPPINDPEFRSPDEFASARELVQLAREVSDFSLAVAMHPEGHPNAPSAEHDRDHQAAKLHEADFGITQFFFEASQYRSLVDELARRGVKKPIIPGIIAPSSVGQLERLSALSGAQIPGWVGERLQNGHDEEASGIALAVELGEELLSVGAPGLHLYTMNHPDRTRQLLHRIRPLYREVSL